MVADPISSLASTSASTGSIAGNPAKNAIDQKTFLRLMIAQFKNQDPTKPQDPSQFLGQLAQFSTVTGIQDMQSSLSTLASTLRSEGALSGAVMVGREVLAPASSIIMGEGEGIGGALEVPEGASNVDVVIKDQVGQTIRHYSMPAAAGLYNFAWDGVTDKGTDASTGQYNVSVTANIGGKSHSVPVLMNSQVMSVTIDPKSNELTLNTRGLGAVALSNVRRVM